MGKKKSKTVNYQTTTVNTTVVKLSYLQTLAVAQGLIDPQSELETAGESGITQDKAKTKTSFIPFLGIGKGKSSVKTTFDTSGLKLKDQWLQPYFDRIRYTIGIKELVVAKYTFAEKSEFISVPFLSPKEVIKVHVVVDEYIPPQFDENQTWIQYFIKPEGSDTWIEIAPQNAKTKFNSTGDIVPKIINFNIPKPAIVAIESKFNYTPDPVKKLRFKAVLSRPVGGDNDSITPLLKSYRMIMVPRD